MAKILIKELLMRLVSISPRLQDVVSGYLLMLMIEAHRHTQTLASAVSGLHQSQYSRLLTHHRDLAKLTLEELSAAVARSMRLSRQPLVKGAKWTIGILIDATLHPRSSLHIQNSQRFNHGQGFVIGHQWTNIVLYINDRAIPLPPIPFWSRNECKRRGVPYKTEHERIEEYLDGLNLAELIGFYGTEEVVVMTDSGYDNKALQNAILERDWDFLGAIKTTRGTKSDADKRSGKKKWTRVSDRFWAARKQAPWKTVRVETDGGKKRRKFRARKLTGFIKGVAQEVALVCSEKSGGTGRRYFACSRADLDAGVILRAYSKRWEVELFHRACKHQLGLLDAGVQDFDSLTAHIHWVYCAWLLLHELQIAGAESLLEKQRRLTKLAHQAPWEEKLRAIIASKSQFGGIDRQQTLLRAALEEAMVA